MKALAATVLLAFSTAALAQSPQSVPLRENTPDGGTSAGRTTTRDGAPPRSQSSDRAPGARNEPNGQVSPPSAINSGVQVIAPERK